MIGTAQYRKLSELFFEKSSKVMNPTEATLEFISASPASAIEAFKGSATPVVTGSYKVRCLYTENITPKQRDKFGINDEVSAIVYLSPLELKRVANMDTLPADVIKSLSGLIITLLGNRYCLESIKQKAPITVSGTTYVIAYQLNLKGL